MKLRKGDKILKPVLPNAGVEAEYRRRLDELVEDMSDSYSYWLTASYRRNRPEMAQDREPGEPPRVTAAQVKIGTNNTAWAVYVDGEALRNKSTGIIRTFRSRTAAETAGVRSAGLNVQLTASILIGERLDKLALANAEVVFTPAANLQEALDGLKVRWERNFEETAPKLARWFAESAAARSQDRLKNILREGGMSVQFQMTPAMRDVAEATVAQNVSLIKSIGSQYHTEVEGLVMRSVTDGRDLGFLAKELQARYGITKRRAAFISLDQNNKCTAAFRRVRETEAGLDEGIWMHSAGGKEPRPTHVAQSGKKFSIKDGWPDPALGGKRIWPGTEPNCRCTWRVLIKGFS